MDMTIKNEENKRMNCMYMADNDFQVTAKRRLRGPVLTSEENQGQKQQVCQNSITNTTKRSSRFRGVSR
ncbi:hypothetical protein RYX36_008633, partial [Vicia faba]